MDQNSMSFFQEDDYDKIYDYFLPLRKSGQVDADPSGWLDTYAVAAELLPDFKVSPQHLARYRIDESTTLGETKSKIINLISDWEERELAADNVTLCHSVSEATLSALIFLKRNNVSTIIFETPAYAVTINQAKHLGFSTLLIPTHVEDEYQVRLEEIDFDHKSAFALWLTHPRMSLGFDQSISFVQAALATLSARDFLVIDEATEQRFPSHLRSIWDLDCHWNVLRLRGFLKGAGLNGLRLAFLLHHTIHRSGLEASQEVIGTSLDAFSLQAAVAVADIPGRMRDLLQVANQQTTSLRLRAEKVTLGTGVQVSHLVNGYIGCFMLNFERIPGSYTEKRQRLLEFCLSRRMPVILGSSMRFAFDPNWERIRVNYFSQGSHVLRGAANLVDFAFGLRK